jgi:hypothetical protein
MRYSLQTLMIVTAVGPPILAAGYFIRGTTFFGEFVLFSPLMVIFVFLAVYTWNYMLVEDGYRKR